MEQVNLLTLIELKAALETDDFSEYLILHGISIKDEELKDLEALLLKLFETEQLSVADLDGFYVGYTIDQIGKEFDLLRFNRSSVLNIELKRDASEEKICKQLIRNKYYLDTLGKKIVQYTFCSARAEVYSLDRTERLTSSDIETLSTDIANHSREPLEEIANKFSPTYFLVSPFNTPERFVAGQYFLTLQQEQIRSEIIKKALSEKGPLFFSITGIAGTGKTLLAYDIVKSLMDSLDVTIVHCGYLNEGQEALIREKWNILSIRNFDFNQISGNSVILIDEAQRIRGHQFKSIVDKIVEAGATCIFSHDKNQTLSVSERNTDIPSKIEAIEGIAKYKLSQKIRTNKSMAEFIEGLFTLNSKPNVTQKANIKFTYFSNLENATNYAETLRHEYEVLRFTPSQYNNEFADKYSSAGDATSHKVIGQEFDKVCVILDEHFSYNTSGNLIYRSRSYYDAVRMLFQNLTRTRVKLHLVIANNHKILNRIVCILK